MAISSYLPFSSAKAPSTRRSSRSSITCLQPPGPAQVVVGTVVLSDLLPPDKTTYRYLGSLTTPPCSEGVHWVIFTQPVEVSTVQIDTFGALYPENARPTQPLMDREVVEGQ